MYYTLLQQCCMMTWFMIFFFFMTWLPMIFFFFSHTRDKSQAEIIFCLNCWIIDAKHCAEIADWSRRGSNHDKPVQIQIHMCYTLCACNINGGEVYLLPSRAAASAVIGAVCSRAAAFPLLSPLPRPHPPSFTLCTPWISLSSGCSHHYRASTSLLWRIYPALLPLLSDPILIHRWSTELSSLKPVFFFSFFFPSRTAECRGERLPFPVAVGE